MSSLFRLKFKLLRRSVTVWQCDGVTRCDVIKMETSSILVLTKAGSSERKECLLSTGRGGLNFPACRQIKEGRITDTDWLPARLRHISLEMQKFPSSQQCFLWKSCDELQAADWLVVWSLCCCHSQSLQAWVQHGPSNAAFSRPKCLAVTAVWESRLE